MNATEKEKLFNATNIKSITKDLQMWADSTEKGLEQLVNEVVNDISTNAQAQSPVRTGLFKASWFVEIKSKTNKIIRNTLEYATFLAMGGSKQASAGWIDRIIDRALAKFK